MMFILKQKVFWKTFDAQLYYYTFYTCSVLQSHGYSLTVPTRKRVKRNSSYALFPAKMPGTDITEIFIPLEMTHQQESHELNAVKLAKFWE